MKRTVGMLGISIVLGSVLPRAGEAQVAWDAPSMMQPGAPSGLSVFLVDPDPAADLGVMAIWRRSPAPIGLGFRGALANTPRNELAALFGVDVSGSLGVVGAPEGPSVMWWSGAGIGLDHHARISFPAGLVFGWAAQSQEVSFQPFVGGHVALDVLTAGGGHMHLNGAVDLGVELAFRSGWAIRFGASVGDRDGLAIGVRLPGTG